MCMKCCNPGDCTTWCWSFAWLHVTLVSCVYSMEKGQFLLSLAIGQPVRCHQFFPFGFNSDLTISSDGHGGDPEWSWLTWGRLQTMSYHVLPLDWLLKVDSGLRISAELVKRHVPKVSKGQTSLTQQRPICAAAACFWWECPGIIGLLRVKVTLQKDQPQPNRADGLFGSESLENLRLVVEDLCLRLAVMYILTKLCFVPTKIPKLVCKVRSQRFLQKNMILSIIELLFTPTLWWLACFWAGLDLTSLTYRRWTN